MFGTGQLYFVSQGKANSHVERGIFFLFRNCEKVKPASWTRLFSLGCRRAKFLFFGRPSFGNLPPFTIRNFRKSKLTKFNNMPDFFSKETKNIFKCQFLDLWKFTFFWGNFKCRSQGNSNQFVEALGINRPVFSGIKLRINPDNFFHKR